MEAARRVSQAAGPSTADDEVEADAPSTLGLAKKLLLGELEAQGIRDTSAEDC